MDAIYLRKSRVDLDAEKSGSGNTLLRHKTTLLELAKRQGREIGEIYEEVRSGETIAARPEMQRLLHDVENRKWDAVLVMEIERLARGDSIDQGIVSQAFQYSGTKIVTPVKTYDPNNEFDEEYFEFGLFMSRREYKSIRRRMEAGKVAAVKEGKFLGKTAPFGYERMRIENGKGWTLRIVPEQAAVVHQIFHMHADKGYGFQKIAHILNSENILTGKGNPWSAFAVRSILDNITYAGYVYWGRRPVVRTSKGSEPIKHRPVQDAYLICKGIHKPIISKELYDASQARRRSHPDIPLRNDTKLVNPLQGILYCHQCGHRMQLVVRNGKTPSLCCRNLACGNVSARLPVVEDTLITALDSWLSAYTVDIGDRTYIAELHDRVQQAKNAQKRISRLLEQEAVRLGCAYDMLELGIYSPEEFVTRRNTIAQKQQELQDKFDTAAKAEHDSTETLTQQKQLVPRVEHLLHAYTDAASAKEKNDMLKAIVTRIDYEKVKQYDDSSIKLYIFPVLKQK
ncbi:MAG: recombinase family protein [Eubacteriales bacterium]|nr:recombinase family protein [Eubacteriales bacterium]